MSDTTFQTKVHGNQGGNRLTIESGGTIDVLSGGSIAVTGALSIESGGSITGAGGLNVTSAVIGTLTLGGTTGRWAFGSATLASGTTHIFTGLGTVLSANVIPVVAGINAGTGAGTATGFQLDVSRVTSGTVIALGVTGTAAFTGAGTVLWQAFGR